MVSRSMFSNHPISFTAIKAIDIIYIFTFWNTSINGEIHNTWTKKSAYLLCCWQWLESFTDVSEAWELGSFCIKGTFLRNILYSRGTKVMRSKEFYYICSKHEFQITSTRPIQIHLQICILFSFFFLLSTIYYELYKAVISTLQM